MNAGNHEPVLLAESIAALQIKATGLYVDGTFGRGGHSAQILQQLGTQGKLVALDKDPVAVEVGQEKFAGDARFQIVHSSFAQMKSALEDLGLAGKIDGVLLDLGVSSPQLDQSERGFSFQSDGPLDMRMDTTQGLSAREWLAVADEEEIRQVLKNYGEERFAKSVARKIVAIRLEEEITTTKQLARIIASAIPKKDKHKHPATRSFQGIRIFINSELDDLLHCLANLPDLLSAGGRLVIISFHSLEDRIVKQFIAKEVKGEVIPPDMPIMGEGKKGRLKKIGKFTIAGKEELRLNFRARSAVMRIAERRQ